MKKIFYVSLVVFLCSFTGGDNTSWFAGKWEGIALQITPPNSTWTMDFTADPTTNSYKIVYPSLQCYGYWTLVHSDEHVAEFKELITHNTDSCVERGRVVLTKIDDDYITFSYFYLNNNELGSYCTLKKEREGE